MKQKELTKNKCYELHPVAMNLAKESWVFQLRVLPSAKCEALKEVKIIAIIQAWLTLAPRGSTLANW